MRAYGSSCRKPCLTTKCIGDDVVMIIGYDYGSTNASTPSVTDIPAQTTVTNKLCEQLIPSLQCINAVSRFIAYFERNAVVCPSLRYSGYVVSFKCPQCLRSDCGLERYASRIDTDVPVMKVALLILGCAMHSPNVKFELLGIVVIGSHVAWCTLAIFAAVSATSHRFDSLTWFHLDRSNNPFGYGGQVRTT